MIVKNVGFLKIITIFSSICLFFAFSVQAATDCHLLSSATPPTGGFGAAFNVFSSGKETIVKAKCDTTGVDLEIGTGEATQYVYKYAYLLNGASWDKITLNPVGSVNGDWLVGKGKARITLTPAKLAQENQLITYTCTKVGSIWKCGCKDTTCSAGNWQLQKFKSASPCSPQLEICGNGLDEDCNGSDLVCTETVKPIVTAFSITPVSTEEGSQITVSYSATDNSALAKIELWRANYNVSTCSTGKETSCVWQKKTEKSISGTSNSGTLVDTPTAGTYWYGLHAIDASANQGMEPATPGPLKVVATAAAGLGIQDGIIFYATSPVNSGNLGGRSGADNVCTNNLPVGLTCNSLHAFLSVNNEDEVRDMPNKYSYNTASPLYWYHKTNKTLKKFANNWADALDGSIETDACTGTGVLMGGSMLGYWTGSYVDGSNAELKDPGRVNCSGWSSASSYGSRGTCDINSKWIWNTGKTLCSRADAAVLCACNYVKQVVSVKSAETTFYATPANHNGNYGGRSGIDSYCESNKPSNLSCGNIHAFVSYGNNDEIRDMPEKYGYIASEALYWYNNANKQYTKFANNWGDALDNSIEVSAKSGTGEILANGYWTGSYVDGSNEESRIPGYGNCGVWTSSSVYGTRGVGSKTDSEWIYKSGKYLCSYANSAVLCACNNNAICSAKPANTVWNSVGSITQTLDGDTLTPSNTSRYDLSPSATECRYKCAENYTWNGSACIANTQEATCVNKPSNSAWNSVSKITQTWNGFEWAPSNIASHSIDSSTTRCRYKCNFNYNYKDGLCQPSSYESGCTTKPSNSEWNTVSSIRITWNGSAFVPSINPVYNITPSETECRYKCKSGYIWQGNSCVLP